MGLEDVSTLEPRLVELMAFHASLIGEARRDAASSELTQVPVYAITVRGASFDGGAVADPGVAVLYRIENPEAERYAPYHDAIARYQFAWPTPEFVIMVTVHEKGPHGVRHSWLRTCWL